MQNVRKHRNIKRNNKLFGIRTKSSYCKVFSRKYVAVEMKKSSNAHE